MRIHLSQLGDEPFRWHEERQVPVEQLEQPDLLALGPVEWRGQVTRTEAGFLLTSTYRYDQTLACMRCLTPLRQPVQGEVQLLLALGAEGSEPPAEQALEAEELGVLFVAGDTLETDPILVEQLQLNVPMKPLCRPDCRGLCPSCGADRNSGSCGCGGEAPDPRWSALAALAAGRES